MAKRQREWAARVRDNLIQSLGGKCCKCGSKDKLQVDHIYGRDWDIIKAGFSWRMSIYRREAALNLLQLQCDSCHSKRSNDLNRNGQMPINFGVGIQIPKTLRLVDTPF